MYIFRRGDRWWFRKSCPVDLGAVFGAEVRCSLHTSSRQEARRRATLLAVALDDVFELLRSERPLEPAQRLLGAVLDDFRQNPAGTPQGHLLAAAGLQKAASALGVPAVTLPTVDGQTLVAIDNLDPIFDRERPRAEANQIAIDLLRLAARIRQERGWSRTDRAKALVALCQKLTAASEMAGLDSPSGLAAVRAILREEISRAGFRTTINQAPQFDPEALREMVAGEVRAGVAAAGRERWSDEPLSDAIERFLAAKYPKGKQKGKQVGSKHREDVERRLAAFKRFVGNDSPIRDLTRDQLKQYRDVLDQLPERFEARFHTQDMRIAITKNADRKVPFPSIGPTTVDLKWLGPVNRLFEWLVIEEKIEKSPCDGIRSGQEDGEAANSKRLPFKPEQISKIFAITSAASPKTALYWMPLLMFCTGARPNELAQLRTDDLDLQFNDQPHLNLLCLLDGDDEAVVPIKKVDDIRRVKSPAGRRMVPIHPILIEAGFIRFMQERHGNLPKQLFRELHADRHGFWSSAINKRINRIVREKLAITNPKYSVYSFRHSFIDACKKAGIAEEVRMKYMGHQIAGPQGIYGNPLVLEHESRLFNSIVLEEIDFGKYLVGATH